MSSILFLIVLGSARPTDLTLRLSSSLMVSCLRVALPVGLASITSALSTSSTTSNDPGSRENEDGMGVYEEAEEDGRAWASPSSRATSQSGSSEAGMQSGGTSWREKHTHSLANLGYKPKQ